MEEDPSETGSVSEASAETWPLGPAVLSTGPPSAHSADPDQSFSARSWQNEQEASESTALNSPSVADGVASFGRSTVPAQQMGDPVRRKEDKSKSLEQIDHLGPCNEDGKHIDAAEFDKAETAALNDEVERSILELLDVVKACRRKSQAANTLLESRDVPQAHTDHSDTQRPPDGTVKAHKIAQVRPSSAPSRKGQAADATRRSDVAKRLRATSPRTTNEAEVKPTPARAEDPAALARIDALQAEAALLRAELREADLQIQTAASESAAANADLRETRLRHQRWLRSTQEESFRLRKENQRLEKSCHQANAEERRIADLAQSQPVRLPRGESIYTSAICQKLAALKAACEKLESENEKLEQELQAGQADLNSVRDVPQAGPSRSVQRSSPSVVGQNRALTPPGRGPAKRLEQNSSTPVLRRSLRG